MEKVLFNKDQLHVMWLRRSDTISNGDKLMHRVSPLFVESVCVCCVCVFAYKNIGKVLQVQKLCESFLHFNTHFTFAKRIKEDFTFYETLKIFVMHADLVQKICLIVIFPRDDANTQAQSLNFTLRRTKFVFFFCLIWLMSKSV